MSYCLILYIFFDLVITIQHVTLECKAWDEENDFQVTHACRAQAAVIAYLKYAAERQGGKNGESQEHECHHESHEE